MNRRPRASALILFAHAALAADWHTGQAARAVLGQPSFSAHASGLNPTALSLGSDALFVAEAGGRVQTFALKQLFTADSPCAVCGGSPLQTASQSVPAASAQFATEGSAVAIADSANHRVLLWRSKANTDPDLILTPSNAGLLDPVSVALDSRYLYVGDASLHRVLIWSLAALSSAQPPDAALGNPGPPAANTLGIPVALASNGTDLFVADAPNHRILIFSPAAGFLSPDAVVNSASLVSDSLAPGTLITIRGDRLASTSETAVDDGAQPLPATLGGTTALVNGHPIPILSISPTEIRAQLPYTLTDTTSATLQLQSSSATTNAVALRIAPVSPGIFAFAGKSEPRSAMLLHNGRPVTEADGVSPGEELVVWATGLGLTSADDEAQPAAGVPYAGETAPVRNPVEAEVGGSIVPVASAVLAPGSVGVYEVRLLVPSDLPPASPVTLRLRQGASASNTVLVPTAAINR